MPLRNSSIFRGLNACAAARHLPGSNPSSGAAQQGREHEATARGLWPAVDLGRVEKRHPRSHRACCVRAHTGRVAARSVARVPTWKAVSVNARVLARTAHIRPRQLAKRTCSLRQRTLRTATDRARRPNAHPARRMWHSRERPTLSIRVPRVDLCNTT